MDQCLTYSCPLRIDGTVSNAATYSVVTWVCWHVGILRERKTISMRLRRSFVRHVVVATVLVICVYSR